MVQLPLQKNGIIMSVYGFLSRHAAHSRGTTYGQILGHNFFIPMPVVLVGTQVMGKDNFMTVGWCARANANPPMIACGIGNHHYTPKGIMENKTFSVNIPSSDLIEKTDYCGIVSGEKTDKSKVFEVFYGRSRPPP